MSKTVLSPEISYREWTAPPVLSHPQPPLVFSVIEAEMPLNHAALFIRRLEMILGNKHAAVIEKGLVTYLATHDPRTKHLFAFISCSSENRAARQAGMALLIEHLQQRGADKTTCCLSVAPKALQAIRKTLNPPRRQRLPLPSAN